MSLKSESGACERFSSIVLAAVFLFASTSAIAQCPAGIPSGGNPACVPPDIYYDTPGFSEPPPLPGPQWQTRWGAIVAGGGGFGASVNMTSKRKAVKEAMRACKSTGGGKSCTLMIAYYNQCAAVSWGDGSYSASASAGKIELARELAQAGCSGQTTRCKVLYSECSYPMRIR